MRLCLALLSTMILSCSHSTPKSENGVLGPSEAEYAATVAKYTVKTNQYSGFYQTFQADMTILTTDMQTASLRQRSAFMQWDQKTYQGEHEKMLQESTAYAKFFMRFFSPEHEYDDLHKGKTIWKIYLDYAGQR